MLYILNYNNDDNSVKYSTKHIILNDILKQSVKVL